MPQLSKQDELGGVPKLGSSETKNPRSSSRIRGLHLFTVVVLSLTALYRSLPFLQWTFGSPASIEDRIAWIFKQAPLIDGHNDIAIKIRVESNNHIYDSDFTSRFVDGQYPGEVDLRRMSAGRYGGAFWSAFVPCQEDITDFSEAAYGPVVQETQTQIDLLHRLLAAYSPPFPTHPTLTAAAAWREFRAGRLVSPLIIEGLHSIGNRAANLRALHAQGVRYATLNWNCHNRFSDAAVLTFMANGSSIVAPPLWGGISQSGRAIVREMNRIGMIVDLSHTSPDTMRDVLAGEHNYDAPRGEEVAGEWTGSVAPPIFSHSSAHALCPHPRNVPDDVLYLVKKRGSVVMVNFLPDFVSCEAPPSGSPKDKLPVLYPKNNTLEHVADHIMHIGDLIGYDHVGIGSDYGALGDAPKGLEDVSKLPDLIVELLKRGVSDENCVKIIGGNILRVWEEVDRVAKKMQDEGVRPLEDELERFRP